LLKVFQKKLMEFAQNTTQPKKGKHIIPSIKRLSIQQLKNKPDRLNIILKNHRYCSAFRKFLIL